VPYLYEKTFGGCITIKYVTWMIKRPREDYDTGRGNETGEATRMFTLEAANAFFAKTIKRIRRS